MANPTTEHPAPLAPMRPTPGIGQGPAAERPAGRAPSPTMTGAPQGPEVKGADPVLFEDIEGVYLARLYPAAFTEAGTAAGAMALEAGAAAQAQGQELVAAQQAPINWEGEGGAPVPTQLPAGPPPHAAQVPAAERERLEREAREKREQEQRDKR